MVANNASDVDATTELGPEYVFPLCETHEDVLAARTPEQQKESDRRGKRWKYLIEHHSREVDLPAARVGKETLEDLRLCTIAEGFVKQSPVNYHFQIADEWSICNKEGKHQQVKKEQIRPFVQQYANRCQMMTSKGPRLFDLTKSKTDGLIDQLSGLPGVYLLPSKAAPCALNSKYDGLTLIAVNNGILDITDRFNPILLPHDKDYYTFHYLPYDYVPGAEAPDWLWALGQYFQEDDGSPDFLARDIVHNWILYYLLNDVSIHRIPTIIGGRRSGKGSIGRAIRAIVGEDTIVNLTVASLSGRFGLESAIGKRLGIMWDANIVGRATDTAQAVERLKNISGQDGFDIDRKRITALACHRLRLNLLIFCNKMLDLKDDSGALAGRWNILQTTGSFYGKEDPSVEARIHQQLPGILNLALRAKKGCILHPSGEGMRESIENLSSPYLGYVSDYCYTDKDAMVPIDIHWLYYCRWAKRSKRGEQSKQNFRVGFHSSIPDTRIVRPNAPDMPYILDFYNVAKIDPELAGDMARRPTMIRGLEINPNIVSQANVPYSGM